MPDFLTAAAEARRLAILAALHQAPGNMMGEALLQDTLQRAGAVASRDVIRADLAWLHDQQLVVADLNIAGPMSARVAQRGADIALGRAVMPGVRRPDPA